MACVVKDAYRDRRSQAGEKMLTATKISISLNLHKSRNVPKHAPIHGRHTTSDVLHKLDATELCRNHIPAHDAG